jgi:hypothetical protein
MKFAICGVMGIIGQGFISSILQSLFIPRRDEFTNSEFSLSSRKTSWWIGGFLMLRTSKSVVQ